MHALPWSLLAAASQSLSLQTLPSRLTEPSSLAAAARFDIADRLRQRGWVVPAYTLAPGCEHIRVLRALCREDFSIASADMCARAPFLPARHLWNRSSCSAVSCVLFCTSQAAD